MCFLQGLLLLTPIGEGIVHAAARDYLEPGLVTRGMLWFRRDLGAE